MPKRTIAQQRVLLSIVRHHSSPSSRLPMSGKDDDSLGLIFLDEGGSEVAEEVGEAAVRTLDIGDGAEAGGGDVEVRRVDEHRFWSKERRRVSKEEETPGKKERGRWKKW
jgi:hypothetical protein